MGRAVLGVGGILLSASLACTGPGSPTPTPPGPPSEPPATAPPGKPVALEALLATSGEDVRAVVDRDPTTSWSPLRDPRLEGVLLRFEEPTPLKGVEVTGCDAVERAEVVLDGAAVSGGRLPLAWTGERTVRSLFVRISEGKKGACLKDVLLTGAGDEALAPEAPRRVEADLRASSTLEPKAAYHPAYLFDGRNHFAWVEGLADDDGLGEKVTVRFEEQRQLAGIEVWNGYQRSDDHFAKNNRVKKLRISADGKGSRELELADRQGPQLVELTPPMGVKELQLEIAEVFPGSKSSDTVISEVRFHDREGPFTLDHDELDQAEKQLRGALDDSPLRRVVGLSFRSRCGGDELKLRPDASFVWYGSEVTGGRVEVDEVFEGAWALESAKAPWPKVGLYGRRTAIEKDLDPYGGGGQPKELTRVSGGTLELATPESLGREAFVAELQALAKGTTKPLVACVFEGEDGVEDLLKSGALLVKGTAITDLMVRRGHVDE